MKRNIVSEKVKRALLQFELSQKEVAAYLVLLEKGALTVSEISRTIGINRVTIYAALDALKRKGLIAKSKRGKRDLFVAENPEALREIVDKKKERLKNDEATLNNLVLPMLKAVDVNQEGKPQIAFYEGREGINKVFDEYALKSRYIIGCGSYDTALKATSWKSEKKFLEEIKRRKILYKVILEDTSINRKFAEMGKGLFHVKFLPEDARVSADIHVFGPFVSLMSYEKISTTLIEEETIAHSIRMYLEFMWDRL